MDKTFPIDQAIPGLAAALSADRHAVLVAAPGAGKTTRVPLALLQEKWLEGRKIVMLEPRRLAARAAARYMAQSLGEKIGETVGYRMKQDTKVSEKTRIEVVTEGVLTRMLQEDPALEQAGLVIFDEFHERSLHADLGLALCLQSREVFRDDLRLLIMSATLEAEPVSTLLGRAPVIVCEGSSYPVATRYLDYSAKDPVGQEAVQAIREALKREEGSMLVFLPGAKEIRRLQTLLAQAGVRPPDAEVVPLYGAMEQAEQDRAVAPSGKGRRKIVLATSIAESSLTVDGITVVVDCGLSRVPRFSPRTGMTRLETVRVSRASADQRRGRAGRLAPGVCYRLWTEQEDRSLPQSAVPEILEADLAYVVLELALWGAASPEELSWLDLPPAASYVQARELLTRLGALDARGAITEHGRAMARLGAHPRMAHMMLKAAGHGRTSLACDIAALLSDRSAARGGEAADLSYALEALRQYACGGQPPAHGTDPAAMDRVLAESARWHRQLGAERTTCEAGKLDSMLGLLLAYAYPDRIGKARGNGRYLLSSGRGAFVPGESRHGNAEWLVAVEVDDSGVEGRIWTYVPLDENLLRGSLSDLIQTEESVEWDADTQSVKGRWRKKIGAIVWKERPLADPSPEAVMEALMSGIRQEGLALLPWSKHATQLRQRIAFMQRLSPGSWPDMSDRHLLDELKEWLGPYIYGMKSKGEWQRLNMADVLTGMLSWEQQTALDREAPSHLAVPSGSRIPIHYETPEAPYVSVRLQEVFGLHETPLIGGGRLPLTFHLLSPAQRPVQVTSDLASFWREAYFEVKKDLKGRYPKHYWPDDPLQAEATRRTRPGR